jgi:hypothetical protein
MARWKSGLLPFEVFAIRVNWDTHSISPCISLMLAFHMLSEELEKIFRPNLSVTVSVPWRARGVRFAES